ncbi:adrenodoxin-like [Lissotriton helveticus]
MTARSIPALLLPLLVSSSRGGARCRRPLAAATRGPHGVCQRGFGSTAPLRDSAAHTGASEDKITVHFINRDGECLTAAASEGESLLDVVMKQNLDIEGYGACEGTLACSTCHLIFEQKIYDQLDPVTDEEMDMLDLAYGLTGTSRLGCQVCMKKAMDGLTVRVPTDVADARREAEIGQKSHQ